MTIYFDFLLDPIDVVGHQIGLFITDFQCVVVFSRHATKCSSSCSSPAKPSMSSAKRRSSNWSASNTDSALMFFQGISHDPFQEDVEEGG